MYFQEKVIVQTKVMHPHYVEIVTAPVSHYLYTSSTGGITRVLFAGNRWFLHLIIASSIL